MTTAEGWSYRVNIADILLDPELDLVERWRRVADRLRRSPWVRSLPEHELIHRHLDDLASGDLARVGLAIDSLYDEATYHRVHIETDLVVPNPESL